MSKAQSGSQDVSPGGIDLLEISWGFCCLEMSFQNAKTPKKVGTVRLFFLEKHMIFGYFLKNPFCVEISSSIRPNI